MLKTYNDFILCDLPKIASSIANDASKKNPSFYSGGLKSEFEDFIKDYFYERYDLERLYEIKLEADSKKLKLSTYIRNQLVRNVTRDFEKKTRVIISEVDIPNTEYYGEDFMSKFSGDYTDLDDAKYFDENYDVPNTDDKKNKTSYSKKSSDEPRLFGKIPSTYEQIEYEEFKDFITENLSTIQLRIMDLIETKTKIVDIAKDLGISRQHVYNHIHEIKKSLDIYIKENHYNYVY